MEDPTNAGSSPIGLEKTRKRRIVASKARGGSDAELQFSPEIYQRWCPKQQGNRFAMMLALKAMEGLDMDFKEGTVDVVESEQTSEGAQGLPVGRKRPVSDQIKLGFGGTVASGSNVMANMLNAVSAEELTLLQLESDLVLHKDITNACKRRRRRAAMTVDQRRMSLMMIRLPR
jgi:hypothetical protein